MLKKILVTGVLVLLVITSVVLFFKWKQSESVIPDIEKKLSQAVYINQRLESNLFSFRGNGKERLESLEIIDEAGRTLAYEELLDSGSRLTLRVHFQHCNLCYEAEFRRLKTLSERVGKERLLVITSFAKRDFLVMLNNFKAALPGVEFVNTNDLLPFEQEFFNQPYYFIIEPDKQAHSFFLPDKAVSYLTDEYYSSLPFSKQN